MRLFDALACDVAWKLDGWLRRDEEVEEVELPSILVRLCGGDVDAMPAVVLAVL